MQTDFQSFGSNMTATQLFYRLTTAGILAIFFFGYAREPETWLFPIGIAVASFVLGYSLRRKQERKDC
jgi:hypothetical protein